EVRSLKFEVGRGRRHAVPPKLRTSNFVLLTSNLIRNNRRAMFVWVSHMSGAPKTDVWQGTLALMTLTTLETMGPLHGYGIAGRIEQTSGDRLSLNYGTLYPALLKREQGGYIASEGGVPENNRKAKFYRLPRAGRKHLERETRDWREATAILGRFLPKEEA